MCVILDDNIRHLKEGIAIQTFSYLCTSTLSAALICASLQKQYITNFWTFFSDAITLYDGNDILSLLRNKRSVVHLCALQIYTIWRLV
jgi:general stress protein CsbA